MDRSIKQRNHAGIRHRAARLHDASSRISFAVSALLLAVIAASFSYEVFARYVLAAPTSWAVPLVSYLLAASIFMAMPELTRQNTHVSLQVFIERMSERGRNRLLVANALVAGLACLACSLILGKEAWLQYLSEITTNPPFAIKKWVLTAIMSAGVASSAIHFLRIALSGRPIQINSGEQL